MSRLVAAGVAFYGFFALLSLLGLIVLVYGFVADPVTVIDHMRALTNVLPTDVAFIIGDQLMNAVKARRKPRGLAILLAFLVATYGGTNGATSVITALNIAYEEKEKRSLVRFYLLAVSMTLLRCCWRSSRSPRPRPWLTSSTCCRKLRRRC